MTGIAVQHFIASQPNVRPARDPDVRRYGNGCDAGRDAALEVFQAPQRFGGTWQHPIIERIPDADHELRGWIVGYLNTLQCLSMADGRRI
jgi:hypothetical protein